MPVSPEELEANGIGKGMSMTRGELNKHLETKKLQAAHEASKNPTESLAREMAGELTEEQIKRAEEAGRQREEMGK